MLGMLIADLSAWTYDNDRDTFYSSLVSPEAVLSTYGESAMQMALSIAEDREMRNDSPYDYSMNSTGIICQAMMYAWVDNPEHDNLSNAQAYRNGAAEKEGHYFLRIAIPYIKSLREGKSKKEAFEIAYGDMPYLADHKIDNDWQHTCGYPRFLGYLNLARKCFEKSFDFTSALHNAAREEGCDRHLLCIITGAMADAMYGYNHRMLKRKYSNEISKSIPRPTQYADSFGIIARFDSRGRHFFPKNNSMTNVEHHVWKKYDSKYEGEAVSEEMARKIMLAFSPGWDDRYGLYLDDGWVYVYRSEFLIARFRMTPSDFGAYKLDDFQSSGENPDVEDIAVQNALYSAKRLGNRR